MTRTRISLLLTGGLLIGLTACGSTDTTTVSSIAPETTVASPSDAVSTSAGPTTTLAATSTTAVTTVAAASAKASTTVVTTAAVTTTAVTAAASKPDLSAVLALVDSAEQSAAAVDKELNTANNAMNSTEQDPQS
jgi:hypothetical protein